MLRAGLVVGVWEVAAVRLRIGRRVAAAAAAAPTVADEAVGALAAQIGLAVTGKVELAVASHSGMVPIFRCGPATTRVVAAGLVSTGGVVRICAFCQYGTTRTII